MCLSWPNYNCHQISKCFTINAAIENIVVSWFHIFTIVMHNSLILQLIINSTMDPASPRRQNESEGSAPEAHANRKVNKKPHKHQRYHQSRPQQSADQWQAGRSSNNVNNHVHRSKTSNPQGPHNSQYFAQPSNIPQYGRNQQHGYHYGNGYFNQQHYSNFNPHFRQSSYPDSQFLPDNNVPPATASPAFAPHDQYYSGVRPKGASFRQRPTNGYLPQGQARFSRDGEGYYDNGANQDWKQSSRNFNGRCDLPFGGERKNRLGVKKQAINTRDDSGISLRPEQVDGVDNRKHNGEVTSLKGESALVRFHKTAHHSWPFDLFFPFQRG